MSLYSLQGFLLLSDSATSRLSIRTPRTLRAVAAGLGRVACCRGLTAPGRVQPVERPLDSLIEGFRRSQGLW
jgi:hypothetical protein